MTAKKNEKIIKKIKDVWSVEPEKFWEKSFVVGASKVPVKMFLIKTDMGHYCGYAIFPKAPFKEGEDYHLGVASVIPVHYGITFARDLDDFFVYGFDCAHAGDDEAEYTKDKKWLIEETERMAVGVLVLQDSEDKFLVANKPTKVWDRYYKGLKRAYWANGLKENEHDDYDCNVIMACLNSLFVASDSRSEALLSELNYLIEEIEEHLKKEE